jgi:hypothetical protein
VQVSTEVVPTIARARERPSEADESALTRYSLVTGDLSIPGLPDDLCNGDYNNNVFESLIRHRREGKTRRAYFKPSSPSYCWMTP